jgi:hypothetical protein
MVLLLVSTGTSVEQVFANVAPAVPEVVEHVFEGALDPERTFGQDVVEQAFVSHHLWRIEP